MKSATNRKKTKTVTTPVWRPISTQGNTREEECPLSDQVSADIQVDNQVAEVQCRMSNSVSDNERARVEAGVVNELIASESSFPVSKKSDESQLPVPSEEKHTIIIEAAASLIRFIKGKESSTQEKLEEEMGVKIIFPLAKEEYIIIKGSSAESVTTASEKLQILIKEAIKSPTVDYTHFVSLPLAIHPQLVEKLLNFQNSILGVSNENEVTYVDDDSNADSVDEEDEETQLDRAPIVAVNHKAEQDNRNAKVGIRNIPLVSYPPKASKPTNLDEKTLALSALGIDKSIFIKPKTLHLTVLMLKLYTKDLVDAAANVLQSLSSKVMDALDGQPVAVRLKGLDCMRGPLAKARVLYAPVEVIGGEDRLLRACQVIIDAFTEAGLVLEKDAQQKLKLHLTLMNARHRKRKKMTRKNDTFDARGIVKQFGSEEWGEYLIHEAHLSQRFVYDENGYYQCRASIPFPESCK